MEDKNIPLKAKTQKTDWLEISRLEEWQQGAIAHIYHKLSAREVFNTESQLGIDKSRKKASKIIFSLLKNDREWKNSTENQ